MRYTGLQVCAALLAFGAAVGAQTPTPTPQTERERIVRRITTTDSARLNQASLGVTLSRTGTRRDTLGIFISSVAENGPAERAGVFEGDRIAAINGVDVRTSASDAADPYLAGVAQRRLTMELRRLTPGQRVSLRVWSGGRYKDVQVTTARLADVYPNRRVLSFGDIVVPQPGVRRELRIAPRMQQRMMLRAYPPAPPTPPTPPTPPVPPAPPEPFSFEFPDGLELADYALGAAEFSLLQAESAMLDAEHSFRELELDLREWEDSLGDIETELLEYELDRGEVDVLTHEALRQARETLASITVEAGAQVSSL